MLKYDCVIQVPKMTNHKTKGKPRLKILTITVVFVNHINNHILSISIKTMLNGKYHTRMIHLTHYNNIKMHITHL